VSNWTDKRTATKAPLPILAAGLWLSLYQQLKNQVKAKDYRQIFLTIWYFAQLCVPLQSVWKRKNED
jgi:hypothetical protein